MKSFKTIGGALFLLVLALAMIKLSGAYAVEDKNSAPPVENTAEANGSVANPDTDDEPAKSEPSITMDITADDGNGTQAQEETPDVVENNDDHIESEEAEGHMAVDTIQQQLTDLEEQGSLPNDQASRALEMHLKAIAQFEKQGASDKVVKHMEGFMQLLEHQKAEGLLTEEAYQALKDEAQALVDQHS